MFPFSQVRTGRLKSLLFAHTIRHGYRCARPALSLACRSNASHWTSTAELDVRWVDSLTEAVLSLEIPPDDGFIWATGESRTMAVLRKQIMTESGADPIRMRIAAYWKQGEADHHEQLKSTS